MSSCAARRAPEGVVGEADKFVIILGVRAQTSNRNRHTVFQIAVQAWVWGRLSSCEIMQELLGSRLGSSSS